MSLMHDNIFRFELNKAGVINAKYVKINFALNFDRYMTRFLNENILMLIQPFFNYL